MINSLRGRSVTKLQDFSAQELAVLLKEAKRLKNDKVAGIEHKHLSGKNIALIFDKDSIVTRAGFEIALHDQGGYVSHLGQSDHHFGDSVSIKDTARALGRLYDGIEYRGSDQSMVELLSIYAGIPVYNGLSDKFHPTQILADFLTMKEHSEKRLADISFCFIGDAKNSIGNSLLLSAAKMGMDIRICGPEIFWPDESAIRHAYADATRSDAVIEFTEDIEKAVKGCDFIYTEAWLPLTDEKDWQSKHALLADYQVNREMMEMTELEGSKFMHSLPAFHNNDSALAKRFSKKYNTCELEVTDDVFESDSAIVFDQVENRLHTIKAILVSTL